jgi:hypothetical protein
MTAHSYRPWDLPQSEEVHAHFLRVLWVQDGFEAMFAPVLREAEALYSHCRALSRAGRLLTERLRACDSLLAERYGSDVRTRRIVRFRKRGLEARRLSLRVCVLRLGASYVRACAQYSECLDRLKAYSWAQFIALVQNKMNLS